MGAGSNLKLDQTHADLTAPAFIYKRIPKNIGTGQKTQYVPVNRLACLLLNRTCKTRIQTCRAAVWFHVRQYFHGLVVGDIWGRGPQDNVNENDRNKTEFHLNYDT